jgi:DNA-directed RNA polymerase beta' subunit
MVNRNRNQGTNAEVRVERIVTEAGFQALLMRSRGRNDQADVEISHPTLGPIRVSVKDGERLNTVGELQRVGARSGLGRERSVVWQTQKYTAEGNQRRSSRRGVMVSEELFIELLQMAARVRSRRRPT